jgi:predicted alpha/beta superfamily hydrolase
MPRLAALLTLVLLAGPAHAAAARPLEIGQELELFSQVLGEERRVRIRIPAAYDRTERRYPVLYLTDAEAQFTHTAATVEFLARNGRMPEMIVVAIGNTNRTRDLTPTRVTAGFPGAAELADSGGAGRFLQFIETELIPWVEARYRTEPYRVFAGHSFGGLFAVHTLATRPALFNAVIAVSPTLHWDRNLPVRELSNLLDRRAELKRTLVVTIGDEPEVVPAYESLEAVLRREKHPGFEYHLERMRDEDHGSLVLRTHYIGLRKVFDRWAPPAGADTLTKLTRHYGELSERLEWNVRPPEAVVNLAGYRAVADKRINDALELFQWNIATYPESPNVYDSFGEGLEAAGRIGEAAEQYRRAIELGERSGDPNAPIFRQHLEAVQRTGTR